VLIASETREKLAQETELLTELPQLAHSETHRRIAELVVHDKGLHFDFGKRGRRDWQLKRESDGRRFDRGIEEWQTRSRRQRLRRQVGCGLSCRSCHARDQALPRSRGSRGGTRGRAFERGCQKHGGGRGVSFVGSCKKEIGEAKKQSSQAAAITSSDDMRSGYANERTSEDDDEKLKRGPDGAD
jgi:hypothetical protein